VKNTDDWGMESYSIDLRKRVVEAYGQESGRGSQARLAKRFGVSPAWVCGLLLRYRQTGDYGPLRTRRGRKAVFVGRRREQLEDLVARQPDATLAELRDRTGVTCSLAAICRTLQRWGYRRKKRRSGPLSKIVPMSSGSGNSGG
jgi:transposase